MAKINKNLVFIYAENARVKISEIAYLLRKSSQRVKYSLKTMEKEKIVYNPFCIFDYSYFGLILFRVYFKGAYVSEKDKLDIIDKLTGNDYVVSVYELNGEFDLVVEIEAPNPSRFNKILKSISDLIPTLKHYKVLLNIVTHFYPKLYLIKDDALRSSAPQEIIIGGDRYIENFSDKELIVMKNLLENPKLRMTTLAKLSSLNVKTAKFVLNGLFEKNVIRGFKYVIDINKLGIHKFRLFLKLHNLIKERERDLMGYLLKKTEIVQANKTVGDWDLEIDIESLDKTRIRQLVVEIKEIFKDIIETFNIMEFYQYYTRSYLPLYFFKKSEAMITQKYH